MTVDWPRVMQDLKGYGYSYRRLQAELGIDKDHCVHIVRGLEPFYGEAVLLLDLLKRCEENPPSVAQKLPNEKATVIQGDA